MSFDREPDEDEHAAICDRGNGNLLVDGVMSFREVMARLELSSSVRTDSFQALAGFCLHHLGGIPAEHAAFDVEDWQFEAIDIDELLIDRAAASKVRYQ